MKASLAFKEVIQAHLNQRAAQDEVFAQRLAIPEKKIDDCITYILNTVKKSGQMGFADEEIFGMAAHYYDEDKIDVGGAVKATVVVNHTVDLTAQEKEQARKKALDLAVQEARDKMKKPAKKAAPIPSADSKPIVQQSLF